MNQNIFEAAQDNYRLIQPGEYKCEVCSFVRYTIENGETIEFYLKYVDGNIKKNISKLYVFTSRSRSVTMNELLAVLYPFNLWINDVAILSRLYADSSMLDSLCVSLIGKCLTLKVEYKMRNGVPFKVLQLLA